MSTTTEPGIYHGLTYAEYDAIPAIRSSDIRNALVSAKRYRARRDRPLGDSPAFRKGRAVHTGVLEPLQFLEEYARWEGDRRSKAYKEWAAQQGDKTILTAAEYDEVKAMATAARSHKVARRILSNGDAEVTVVWRDDETGLLCKARPDWVNGELVDVKTTRDIEARLFNASIARYGYHIQLAYYLDGLKVCDGKDRPVHIIAIESGHPHDVAVYGLPWMMLSEGRDQYRMGLDIIARAEKTGEFHGYAPDEVIPAELPAWAIAEEGEGAA